MKLFILIIFFQPLDLFFAGCNHLLESIQTSVQSPAYKLVSSDKLLLCSCWHRIYIYICNMYQLFNFYIIQYYSILSNIIQYYKYITHIYTIMMLIVVLIQIYTITTIIQIASQQQQKNIQKIIIYVKNIKNNQRIKQMNPYLHNYNTSTSPYPINNSSPYNNINIFETYSKQTPYQSQQFLDKTFNYNDEYIRAYKTLTHEIKLKFYLSVQEMKMLGYMNDRDGYQGILKEIARRVMLMKHQALKKKESQVSNGSNGWGNKIQNLCENHLKKMQNDDLLDDLPIGAPVYHSNTLHGIDFLSQETPQTTNNYQFMQPTQSQYQPNNQHSTQTHKESSQNQDQQFQWAQQSQTIPPPTSTSDIHTQQYLPQLPISDPIITNTHTLNKSSTKQQYSSQAQFHYQYPEIQHPNIQQKQQIRQQVKQQQKQQGQQQQWQWNQEETSNQQQNVISPNKLQNLETNQLYENVNHNIKVYQPAIMKIQQPKMMPIDIWDLDVNQAINQQKKYISQAFKQNKNQPKPINVQKPSLSRKAASQHQFQITQQQQQQQTAYNNMINERDLSVKSTQPNFNKNHSKNTNKNIIGGFNNMYAPSRTTSDHYSQYQDQFYTNTYEPNYQHVNNDQQFTFSKTNTNIDYEYSRNCDDEGRNAEQEGYVNIDGSVSAGTHGQHNYKHNYQHNYQQKQGDLFQWHANEGKQYKQGQYGQTKDREWQLQAVRDNGQTYGNNNQVKDQYLFMSGNVSNGNMDNQVNFNGDQLAMFSFQPAKTIQKKQQDFNIDFLNGNQDDSIRNSSSQWPGIQTDTHFLDIFKCQPKVEKIVNYLKSNYFDLDRHFYDQSMQLVQDLGYKQSDDYCYLSQQRHICSQIFRLTELYTSAVDETEQHVVKQAIQKSKELCNQLKISKTVEVVKKYLQMKGITRNYKIAKLSLDAGISKQLIQKFVSSQNLSHILVAQYAIENLSSIQNIAILSTYVAQYVESQLCQMENIALELKQLPQKVQKLIRNSSKFQQFKQNLIQIVNISKQFLNLGKICLKKDCDSNIIALEQHIKEILPTDDSDKQLIPDQYVNFYTQFACNPNTTIYSLFTEFRNFMAKHPICTLCLKSIKQPENGTKKCHQDNQYYHYRCHNLEKAIHKYKQKCLQPLEIPEMNQPQQQEQIEQPQNTNCIKYQNESQIHESLSQQQEEREEVEQNQ